MYIIKTIIDNIIYIIINKNIINEIKDKIYWNDKWDIIYKNKLINVYINNKNKEYHFNMDYYNIELYFMDKPFEELYYNIFIKKLPYY